MLSWGLPGGARRPPQSARQHGLRRLTIRTGRHRLRFSTLLPAIFAWSLLISLLLPAGASYPPALALPGPAASLAMPVVSGVDYSLHGSVFTQGDGEEVHETSFKGKLVLPAGATHTTFTSEPLRAPIDFSDVAPHWWADQPDGTWLTVEVRTSRDGAGWSEWELAEQDDLVLATDSYTETFASPIPVNQVERTHRYVQSRITLASSVAGISPSLNSLAYTFINAGVTPALPRPRVLAQGTPSDVPKPPMISRIDWGSPQGESSPRWTPTYRRVTHMVIHHTATSNSDTDFPARVRSIWYYHAKTRGWGDIGYNYVIDPNGTIYEGRAGGDDVQAGHAYPFNVGTMGVGMLGNFMKQAPTQQATQSLVEILSWKSAQRGIDPHATLPITGYTECGGKITYTRPTIAGHRDFRGEACNRKFNSSTCPGDVLSGLLPTIRDQVVREQPPLRANFGAHNTPGNMEPGVSIDVQLSVRNSGSLAWRTGGSPSVVMSYRWLTKDGQPVQGVQEIRSPLPRSVGFADTLTMTARLTTPTVHGHYALIWDLYVEGQGWFADQGSKPLRVDVVVGKNADDKTPPTSQVLPLPMWSSEVDLPIRWAGEDNPQGAGVASFDIQYRIAPRGPWVEWKTATNETHSVFTGEDGVTYEFRSRARDAAGNVEEWPTQADTYTTIDTRPPPLIIDDPESGDHVAPGTVIVHGRTEAGTFIAVNDRRADEGSGVFTSTVQAQGRDFVIHVTATDPAGNTSRLEITVQAAPRFSDVPMGHPAFRAIEYLSDKGIAGGYTDGLFRPGALATRAQYAKMLVTTMGWGLIRPSEPRFTDVQPDHPLFAHIETVAARLVLSGFPNGTFEPNQPISRRQAVQSLLAATGNSGINASMLLTDLPPGHWAAYCDSSDIRGRASSVESAEQCGSTRVTRADLAVLVYNLYRSVEVIESTSPLDDQGR